MRNRNWQLSRYYLRIRSWLPCSLKQKNRFMRELSGNVKAFLEQEPTADFEVIEKHFGSAQQIAAAYVDETDTPQLVKGLHIRRKIVSIITICAILSLISCIIALWIQVSEVSKMTNGYGVTVIETISSNTMED